MAYRWIFFLPFVLLFSISASAQTNGSFAAGTTLTAGDNSGPWLSPSGDFAFGFQQQQNKDQFLFSIWFNKIPDQTVVWYPNTINPVVALGSSVRVDSNAGLVLLDPQNRELWRAEGVDIGTSQGFMNDTGNFILKGNDGSLLWQSFQVYADTMLPGQNLEIGSALNSRQSETNFTNGRFYLSFLSEGNLNLTSNVLAQNLDDGVVYYSSSTSDPDNSSNSGVQAVFDSRGSFYVLRKNNQKTQLSPVSADVSGSYLRATLEFDGLFALYSHPRSFSGTNTSWDVVWSVPENICTDLIDKDNTGACGYNSICSIQDQNKRPICDCLKGYTLADPNSKYGDCKPNFILSCDEQQTSDLVMLQQTDVDWPYSDYRYINPATETACNQSCFEDCFCAVSIFRSGQCWKKKLPLSNGRKDMSLGSTAFIKSSSSGYFVPPPPINTDSKSKEKGTISVVLGSVLLGCSLFVLALIAALFFASYLMYRKSTKGKNKASTAVETTLNCFTFKELEEATNDFRDELGSGSFGVVFKGELEIRSRNFHVAVKKLDRLAQEREFRAEVSTIGQTNHKNLVRLLGFCDEGKHRLLVYEYMSNGSLAGFLFSENKSSWNMRKHIAIGVARGLVYLHEECSVQIIHCDIKPQNILLDDYYKVRISDFGLAKLLDISQSKVSMTNVRGTKGYVAPEMFTSNQVTAKVDVYSFGVVLLEIISCRKCLQGIESSEEDWGPLTDFVWDCFEERRLDKVVGNDSEALDDIAMVERFAMVGLWCIQENACLRPTMRKVSQMLEGILEVQIPPCPPTFSTTKDLSHVSE